MNELTKDYLEGVVKKALPLLEETDRRYAAKVVNERGHGAGNDFTLNALRAASRRFRFVADDVAVSDRLNDTVVAAGLALKLLDPNVK